MEERGGRGWWNKLRLTCGGGGGRGWWNKLTLTCGGEGGEGGGIS